MKQLRIRHDYNRKTDAEFSVFCSFICASVTNNPHFPAPTPTMADFETAIADYTLATSKAGSGDRQYILERKALRQGLSAQLLLLSQYILYCAAGDELIVLSSGFELCRPRSSRTTITAPEKLVLTNGKNKGELLLKLKRVRHVNMYSYEIAECPLTAETVWHKHTASTSSYLFTGLPSGKEHACRVTAIGSRNQQLRSSELRRFVL